MSRGNFRFPIFEEERDREVFLGKLIEFAGRFGVKIRAYGIMVNHWHVYVQTTEANLSRFMQKVSVRRECRVQAALTAWCKMDELIATVSAQYGCERQELLRP
jgi:REP element-mobilizing transposase RayT